MINPYKIQRDKKGKDKSLTNLVSCIIIPGAAITHAVQEYNSQKGRLPNEILGMAMASYTSQFMFQVAFYTFTTASIHRIYEVFVK